MSFWFIPNCTLRTSEHDGAVLFPAEGLPNLTKALSRDHMREWVKHKHPDALPEKFDQDADYLWKLISSLHRDDFVIAAKNKTTIALGEITGDYQHEPGADGGYHAWPVRWIDTEIPLASYKSIQRLADTRIIHSISESEARIQFRKYIPSWQTKGYIVFKWVSTVMLIAELAYFWPRK